MLNFSTCQRTSGILFNNMGSFNRKSEFGKPENLNKLLSKVKKYNSQLCHFSEKSLEIITRM